MNPHPPPRGLFVTGTDTDVGKTFVAAAIARSLVAAGRRVAAYKPVASGLESCADPRGDPHRLWEAAGRRGSPATVCPQVFRAPLSPPRAAAAEGRFVDEGLLRSGLTAWGDCELVVVEGAGGLFSPLGTTMLGVELAREFGYPLVVVDSSRLGAVGRTLATVRAAIAEGLSVAACVLSQVAPPRGAAADPTSDESIASAALADLRRLLPGVPIARLAHAAAAVDPALDWGRAAG